MRPVPPVTLLAISGSLRSGSSNSLLIEAAARLAPAGTRILVYRGLNDLPHFNPDLDTPARPATVELLRHLVALADGILISSPEYAHGVPGSFKNALDWLVSGTEFPNIPVALLSVSPHAVHARASLAETLRTMSADLVEQASITIPFATRPATVDGILADSAACTSLGTAIGLMVAAARASQLAGRRFVSRPLDADRT
jgi:NAD(P)H-dependent FMN reductase